MAVMLKVSSVKTDETVFSRISIMTSVHQTLHIVTHHPRDRFISLIIVFN